MTFISLIPVHLAVVILFVLCLLLERCVKRLAEHAKNLDQRVRDLEREHNLRQAVYVKILNNQAAMLQRIEKMEDPAWLEPLSHPFKDHPLTAEPPQPLPTHLSEPLW